MIEVEAVTKRFGATLAVDDVSFQVPRGQVVGFLGPNGAGKSTLLKMIATWLEPDAGRIRVAGHDTRTADLAVRRALGYLPEHNALYDTMRVDRFLRFIGRVRELDEALLEERLAWVAERCGLAAVWSKRLDTCSKGNRQRVGLAAALLHDPPVVLLDEPTHGLDPLQVDAFLAFVRELASERAILFSSHVLAEVAAVADRLLVVHQGRLVLDEELELARARAAEVRLSLDDYVLATLRARP